MLKVQPLLRHLELVELAHRLAYALHSLHYISACLADRADRECWLAEGADARDRVLVTEMHFANIGDPDTAEASGGAVRGAPQQHCTHTFGCFQLGIGTYDIAPLAFGNVAGRDRGVGGAQRAHHIRYGEAVACHLVRVHRYAEFALRPAEHVHSRDAWYPFEPLLDNVLDEIAIFVNRLRIAFLALDNEPGDRLILGAGSADSRFVSLLRITRYPVEPVGDEEERAVHVLTNLKFEGDLGAVILRLTDHAAQALEALQHLLLTVSHLALDLDRRRAVPIGVDGKHGLAYVGGELDWDDTERDEAEQ